MRNQNIIPGRGIEKYAVGSRGKAGEENCSKHLRDSSQFHRPASESHQRSSGHTLDGIAGCHTMKN